MNKQWNNIPLELQRLQRWINWRYEFIDGKQTKVPYSPNGNKASVTNPAHWVDFVTAIQAARNFEGIGFILNNDGYSIIDLDNKPHAPCTPEQLVRHQKIYETFDSYAEKSTSGTGVHIIVKGRLPSGVHRDNVEVYSSQRYMICTGDILRNAPIRDFQPMLDILYGEMKPPESVTLEERESQFTDQEVMDMGMRAVNAEKFNALIVGDMTGYPSQSEADFALLAILAFYSPSNEQVRRIFRTTALGKREKTTKSNYHLNVALGKIRANQPEPIGFSQLIANAQAIANSVQSLSKEPPVLSNQQLELPPGLVGELAQYFYSAAIRPVPEIALAAAIALVSGVAGRSYNISGSGLNQYIILLAKTGSGKEGALSGIENLISAIRPQLPMADQFMGPAAFASGQALIRVLNTQPCFLSVLGEFGLTLQQLSDHRANSATIMLRKVLLDLYAKSGWNRVLRPSVYSDTEKNTSIIQAPAVTILGESTPETFFDGLDSSHIAEGLIPRFSVLEYTGDRPARNKNANQPPNPNLAQKFIDLVTISLTTTNNNTCCTVELDSHSLALLDEFDAKADKIMNDSKMDVESQLWNRAHLKALKLSALLAVGVNPHQPVVTGEMAQWAIKFVERDVTLVIKRFQAGDVGTGDSKQFNDLKQAIESYFILPPASLKTYEISKELHKANIVPYRYLMKRTASVASFRKDKNGSTMVLRRTLQSLVEAGMLIEISKVDLIKNFGYSGVAYGISKNWA